MIAYLDAALVSALKQVIGGFGVFLVLALLMDWIGGKLQSAARSLFGRGYDYVLLPGTMCRNAGVALGCLVTGTKMSRSSFSVDGRDVEVDRKRLPVGTPFAVVKRMVILACPLFLGCSLILGVSLLAGSMGILPDSSGVVVNGELPGVVSYFTTMLRAAIGMFTSMVFVWHWTSPFCLLCLYLFFTVATRMTISHHELLGIMSGIIIFALALLLLNLIPGVGTLMTKLAVFAAPCVFVLHAILLFAVLLNIVFYVLLCVLARMFGKKKSRSGK